MTRLQERQEETARFTAYVNDRDRGALPNERLAVRVAEKNLALAAELRAVLHDLASLEVKGHSLIDRLQFSTPSRALAARIYAVLA